MICSIYSMLLKRCNPPKLFMSTYLCPRFHVSGKVLSIESCKPHNPREAII
ncbi:hypothetical protein DsansV1_C15g0137501 [Dioscorea sansibarensis]